jgi:hypothetical protein
MNKVVTASFDYGDSNKFKTLSEVFISSINKNVSGAEIISYLLPEPEIRFNRTRSFISNSVKLKMWVDSVRNCNDGDCVALMDSDMLVIHDFFDVFDNDFDIGYTVRTRSKWPINGGVIFVKVNDKSREFMNLFLSVNNRMLQDTEFHKIWQSRYAGINQAAFGYMLEYPIPINVKIKPFPCRIYNACGEDLPIDEDITKIIHIKGKLRQAIFGEIKTEPELEGSVLSWNKYKEI